MKAFLKNYRQSPRKVRLVVDLIRGKTVPEALAHLEFLPKRASEAMIKTLKSAVANARSTKGFAPENLIVKDIRAEKGLTLKRSMPRARGSANPIHKHSSHITIVLGEANNLKPKI